jgi:hypothetical protein
VCKSAINKKDSLPACFESSMAGMMAPNIFPKWGFPEACMPVNIRMAIIIIYAKINKIDRNSKGFALGHSS